MAQQPHQAPATHRDPANPPPTPMGGAAGQAPVAPPPSPYPGGMASDPAVALANEIVTSIKGALEQARVEQVNADLIGSVAISIRRFADAEVGKLAGGSGLHANRASEK